jgi:single-strand DNA-binding protein
MYQKTIVIGHLGRDPEMRYTQEGTPVTSFSVATTRKWNDRDGNPKEETTWFRVSAWGKQAETCNQYLSKGRLVLVEGTISVQSFKGRDGETKFSLELRADTVRFLGGGQREGGAPSGAAQAASPAPAEGPGEDEIPF